MNFAKIRGLILDMDGVLWKGDVPLPGMPAFLAFLRSQSIRFLLATNNASLTPDQYVRKLDGMGARVLPDEVITSALATAQYLRRILQPGDRVFVIGEDGIRRALEDAGCALAVTGELHAAYVVCAMDRELSWQKLADATINLRNGARLIATNPDTTFPTERGIAHGNGAILAALTAASGVTPVVIGKPQPILFQMALEKLDVAKDAVASLGDRLETDILGSNNAGIASILILTGVTKAADLEGSPIQPGCVVPDLPGLQAAWQRAVSAEYR
jgi:4-nitrophenyl phosphatase